MRCSRSLIYLFGMLNMDKKETCTTCLSCAGTPHHFHLCEVDGGIIYDPETVPACKHYKPLYCDDNEKRKSQTTSDR